VTTVVQLPLEKIEAELTSVFRCPKDASLIAGGIVSEHIRATLFGALHDTSRAQTVHTTHLLSNARRAFQLTWHKSLDAHHAFNTTTAAKDFCGDMLRRIAQLGDAWEADKGQWLTTPLRAVVMDSSNRCLVIGSSPLPLAESRLNTAISCAGASRFSDVAYVKDHSLEQTVDAWLGGAKSLADWTANIIEASESRMEQVGGLSADQLEIYAPDILRNQRRPGRWIAGGEVSRVFAETRLCRPKLQYAPQYNRPHYLAHFAFKNGSLSLQSHAVVARDVSLRLRFGLDMRLATPRQLAIVQAAQTFTIDKPLVLPDPESRVFALGSPDRDADTTSERLTFHNDALPFVLHGLRRLSINPTVTRRVAV
jgi:hypothetical protein